MILKLCDNEFHRIDIIELKNGCFPLLTINIGCKNNEDIIEKKESNVEIKEYYVTKLEPAVWSIILLLDEINVDCSRRQVSWIIKKNSEQEEAVEEATFQRSELQQQECYNYNDDVDQLFDLAYQLLQLSKTQISHKVVNEDKKKEEQYFLIRLLYCYLLPNVKIYKDDLPKVTAALEQQHLNIDKINATIERDSETLDKLYDMLEKQQDQRLHQFEQIIIEENCSKMFLKLLRMTLEKRKRILESELETRQDIVTGIKQDIEANGESVDKKTQLKEARKKTADCQRVIEEILLISRDTIKTALSENTFVETDSEKVILEYLETYEMLNKQKTKTNKQLDKKIRATSIYENLKRIQTELESVGASCSTFHSHSGHRPTDVLADTYFPEYQTLSERVSSIVKNPEHPLGIAFSEFTTSIRVRCHEILEQANEHQKKRRTLDNYFQVPENDSIEVEYQPLLQTLSRDIKEHFHIMATKFQQHFESSAYAVKKLQLCYEDEFYKEVGKEISDVYTKIHEQLLTRTLSDLQVISKLPIDCLELGMKDEYWIELFENRRRLVVSPKFKKNGSKTSSFSSSQSSNSSPDNSPQLNQRARRRSKLRKVIDFIMKESRKVTGNNEGQHENLNTYEWVVDPNIEIEDTPVSEENVKFCETELKKFQEYFGPALDLLQGIFTVYPIYGKLQCLTTAARKVTDSVQQLRHEVVRCEHGDDQSTNMQALALTGDDMLPLLVLVILQMEPKNAAAFHCQLQMIQDLIPDFLLSGVYGWAMMNFNGACHVLKKLCQEFSWSSSLTMSCSSFTHINE